MRSERCYVTNRECGTAGRNTGDWQTKIIIQNNLGIRSPPDGDENLLLALRNIGYILTGIIPFEVRVTLGAGKAMHGGDRLK